MAFFTRAAVPEDTDERGKVFTWTRERRIWMHLSGFLLFSILIHGSGFYLFKVVYPSPVRIEPEPDGITVMEPANPAVRSILQRLADRTIFLMPPSSQSDVRVGLETRRVKFIPAFQRTELELKAPPALLGGPVWVDPLPVEQESESRIHRSGLAGAVKIKLDPALADRPFAPWSILHDYLSLADSLPLIRFRVEIKPGGEVEVTGVETALLKEGEKQELAEAIESTLRFVPSAEIATGWIEVGGEG